MWDFFLINWNYVNKFSLIKIGVAQVAIIHEPNLAIFKI
jgi:hypothetical protein